MLEPNFSLVKKIIGKNGSNTKEIYEASHTKVRVRGKGSGHREAHNDREAPVPLMIALAAECGDPQDFQLAFTKTLELLKDVTKRFNRHSTSRLSEYNRKRFWIGDISDEARTLLADLLGDLIEDKRKW
jgi:hypothetical protein